MVEVHLYLRNGTESAAHHSKRVVRKESIICIIQMPVHINHRVTYGIFAQFRNRRIAFQFVQPGKITDLIPVRRQGVSKMLKRLQGTELCAVEQEPETRAVNDEFPFFITDRILAGREDFLRAADRS